MSDPGLTEEESVMSICDRPGCDVPHGGAYSHAEDERQRRGLPATYQFVVDIVKPPGYTIDPAKQSFLLQDIVNERLRQERLRVSGKFLYTCADSGITDLGRLCVLGEEFGEVAKEINEGSDPERLKAELIQVAAVCVAWAETL